METTWYDPINQLQVQWTRGSVLSWDMGTEHYHNAYECYYLASGDRSFAFSKAGGVLSLGDLLIIPPFQPHLLKRGESEMIDRAVISFRREHLTEVLSQKEAGRLLARFDKPCIFHLNEEQHQLLGDRIRKMTERLDTSDDFQRKMGLFELVLILDWLQKLPLPENQCYEKETVTIREEMLLALRYIHEHYPDSELSLKEVAVSVHMSQSRFCALFKESTGLSCVKYISGMRLERVHTALFMGEKSLKTIAKENGFRSVAQMSRQFYGEYGVTPTDFRRQVEEKYPGAVG